MMMDKVVLTKEQAKAIEWALNEHKFYKNAPELLVQKHGYVRDTERKFADELKPLNSLSTLNLAKALIIGYEVEPEFKVGDWVYCQSDGIVSQITRVNFNKLVPDAINTDGHKGWISCEDIRHATSKEIKQEKERRWWAKHGREVKEYRKGDLFIHPHERRVYEIIEIDPKNSFSIRFIDRFGENDGFSYEAGLRIVCFAEQRLDKEDTQ